MGQHKHQREDWEGYGRPNCIEIGDHVCIEQNGRYGYPDDHVGGFIISHDVAGEQYRCEGAVTVDPELAKDGKVWTMTGSLAGGDLTLSPSILCSLHPEFHAHVVNGRWTGD